MHILSVTNFYYSMFPSGAVEPDLQVCVTEQWMISTSEKWGFFIQKL